MRITSEFGNVSPVIVMPGRWSADHLQYHAENVATQMTQNGAFNCNATQMLILHSDWTQRDAFLDALRAALRALPPRPAYYPGAEERFERFIAAHLFLRTPSVGRGPRGSGIDRGRVGFPTPYSPLTQPPKIACG